MKHRIGGTLDTINARNVKTQYGDKVVYDMMLEDSTKLTTWKKPVAEKAWNLKGKLTYFDCKVTQNGEYTNYTVEEVEDVEEGATMAENLAGAAMFGGAGAMVTGPPTGNFTISTTPATITTTLPTATPQIDKDTSIHRQVATKVAAQFSVTSDEFWQNVESLFTYYQTGVMPLTVGDVQGQQQQSDPLPAVEPDDDIPF